MALLNKNDVYIVGELVEIKDLRQISYGDNQNAISATIVVKCNIGEEENLIEVRNFTNELTKAGAVNKNYATICNLNDMLNKRVVISGARLTSERFWSANSQQLLNSTKVSFNMIRLARSNETEDKATFEFGGFVTNPLVEILDEDGNLKYYEMSIAQANYKEDNMFIVKFALNKDNVKAATAIQRAYEVGTTVQIVGNISTIVTQHKTETPMAFGEPVVKTFTNVDKKFFITSGSNPIQDEGCYDEATIERLIDAYKQEGIAIQTKAASSGETKTASPSTPKVKKSSLAGLL